MYSACKLKKHSDNIQPWRTPFPIWNQSIVPCLILFLLDMQIDFSGGRSGGLLFSALSEYSTVYCDPHSQRLCIDNKAEVDVFLEPSCFLDDPTDVGNLIFGSSAFWKSSLNIWKLSVNILLKPPLENFEHYFINMWDECNCAVVWTFFGIAFLWD